MESNKLAKTREQMMSLLQLRVHQANRGQRRHQGPGSEARAHFGSSWWARRWLQTLEEFQIGSRLDRGRSYARRGDRVISIDVQPGRGHGQGAGNPRASPTM